MGSGFQGQTQLQGQFKAILGGHDTLRQTTKEGTNSLELQYG